MRHVMLISVLFAVIMLTACTPIPVPVRRPFEQSPLDTSPLATAGAPGTADATREKGEAGSAVIIYERYGGLAGIFERWAIYLDGRVMTSDGHEWQLEPKQVEQLLSDIEALGFFELDDAYIPDNTCCDRLTHKLTVRRGDRVHTVTTMDAAPNAPQALWQSIDIMGRLIIGQTE